MHTGAKFGCKLVRFCPIGGYCCPMLAVGVMHTGAKSGCELVMLLSNRLLLLAVGVMLSCIQVPNLGASW